MTCMGRPFWWINALQWCAKSNRGLFTWMRTRQHTESEFALNSNQARPHVIRIILFLINNQCKYTNNKWIMAVNWARTSKTEKKKYHHNVAITVVFDIDSIYGHFYFIAKSTQGEANGSSMLTYGIWRRETLLLVLRAIQSRWWELLQYINPMDQRWTLSWPQLAIRAVSSTFQLLAIYIVSLYYL